MRIQTVDPDYINKCKCIHATLKGEYIIDILYKNPDKTGKQIKYILKCRICKIKWKYYTPIYNPIKCTNVTIFI